MHQHIKSQNQQANREKYRQLLTQICIPRVVRDAYLLTQHLHSTSSELFDLLSCPLRILDPIIGQRSVSQGYHNSAVGLESGTNIHAFVEHEVPIFVPKPR